MSEIINISSSHFANHVLTHLYNNQESHLPYKKGQKLDYINTVFLNRNGKSDGTADYSPRGMLFEHNFGYGALNAFKYYEPQANLEGDFEIIKLAEPIVESEYQKNLDLGKNTASKLDISNTKYWSDYNKLIWRPQSLVSLKNWQHNKNGSLATHASFPNMKFDTFDIGVEEYKLNADEYLEEFRVLLEKSDLPQGLSLFTEIDSAWGGFTNELLIDLRDEYFNTGVSSKHPIWIYGFMDFSRISLSRRYSRIVSLMNLSSNATMLFPMQLHSPSSMLIPGFEEESNWHKSSLYSYSINSIWGLNNKIHHPISMSTIEEEFLHGDFRRNIVNEIKIKRDLKPEISDFGFVSTNKLNQFDSQPLGTNNENEINFSISADGERKFVESCVYKYKQPSNLESKMPASHTRHFYHNEHIDDILKCDTFPKVLEDSTNLHTEFTISDGLKDNLKLFRKVIQGRGTPNWIEDKMELVESISNLIESYTIGFETTDDESD